MRRVSERIHDDEPDTSEGTVRTLLAAQCPQWSDLPITYLRTSGTDNAMWRVHVPESADVVVRLPRRRHAAEKSGQELDLLRLISESSLASVVTTPPVRHVGEPHEEFPHRWGVLGWLDGSDAWSARKTLEGEPESLAADLAEAVLAIGALADVPAPRREPGGRGGPIGPLVQRLGQWLEDPEWRASELIDVATVRRLAAEALEVSDEPVIPRFVHGDLIPGNLLVEAGRLSAVIDWGSAGCADPAQDLAPAWAVLDGHSRHVFRHAVGMDDATWIRARTFELEHAVGGVLYYTPRRHPLGDVMARTLDRILEGR
jgi:aminoglycoside phosphotransferase (APT) family kinase protein